MLHFTSIHQLRLIVNKNKEISFYFFKIAKNLTAEGKNPLRFLLKNYIIRSAGLAILIAAKTDYCLNFTPVFNLNLDKPSLIEAENKNPLDISQTEVYYDYRKRRNSFGCFRQIQFSYLKLTVLHGSQGGYFF